VGSLTDTHCHLNLNTFQEDLAAVLERADECGVSRILIPGIDLPTSRLAVEIAEKNSQIYAAVGVHPSEALTWEDSLLSELVELAHHPKVVAIGEIGLDYYRDHAPRDLQRKVFHQQLELAFDAGLPVSVHNRSAFSDVWSELENWLGILKQNGSNLADHPGVLHSFDGTTQQASLAVQSGFFLGISGPVTFTNGLARQELVRQMPVSALLVETDAPYLSPHPYRGRRNEPAYTRFIVEKIAALHQMDFNAVAQETAMNAARLFAWGAEI
jgi:TatD DNase family protein